MFTYLSNTCSTSVCVLIDTQLLSRFYLKHNSIALSSIYLLFKLTFTRSCSLSSLLLFFDTSGRFTTLRYLRTVLCDDDFVNACSSLAFFHSITRPQHQAKIHFFPLFFLFFSFARDSSVVVVLLPLLLVILFSFS